jgi:hypothetical protein
MFIFSIKPSLKGNRNVDASVSNNKFVLAFLLLFLILSKCKLTFHDIREANISIKPKVSSSLL